MTGHEGYRFLRTVEQPGAVQVTRGEASVVLEAPFEATGESHEVVDVGPGPSGPWRIETSIYSVFWPDGFSVCDPGQGAPCAFDFVGVDGVVVYLQGPFDPPAVPQGTSLLGPGQRLTSDGDLSTGAAVEIAYEHDGVEWRQRHRGVVGSDGRVVVISTQHPAGADPFVVDSVGQIEYSFEWAASA